MDKAKPRIKLLFVIFVALNTLLFSACGASDGTIIERIPKEKVPEESITLTLWVPTDEVDMVDQLVRNFDAVHEEYKIDYEITPLDLGDSITKINESGGDIADVIFIPSSGIPTLVEKGFLHSITEGFDTFKVDLPASAISAVEVDGVAYGVPFSPNSFFMFYNLNFAHKKVL